MQKLKYSLHISTLIPLHPNDFLSSMEHIRNNAPVALFQGFQGDMEYNV